MARVQVLREYRPETFSGKQFSAHFEKQRVWAKAFVRYKNRFTFTPPIPSRFDLFKLWLSWRLHYLQRALDRLIGR